MSRNGWIIFSILCALVLGGLIYVSQLGKTNVSNIKPEVEQSASAENGNIADHVYGNAKSKVILIEYGDFQCPGCGSSYPIVKQVVEKYKDKIGLIFRNFPLSSIHPNALAAAAAAEAAGLQGKYWEMHNRLYETQNAWKDLSNQVRTDYFKNLAAQIGVDTKKWETDLDKEAVTKKIDFDRALGQKAGVSGTPAFFIGTTNVGDKYFEGDKLVPTKTGNAQLVWSDATAFENLVIKPAMKNAGIDF